MPLLILIPLSGALGFGVGYFSSDSFKNVMWFLAVAVVVLLFIKFK